MNIILSTINNNHDTQNEDVPPMTDDFPTPRNGRKTSSFDVPVRRKVVALRS